MWCVCLVCLTATDRTECSLDTGGDPSCFLNDGCSVSGDDGEITQFQVNNLLFILQHHCTDSVKHLEEWIPSQNNSFFRSKGTNRLHIINKILTYLTSLTLILLLFCRPGLRGVEWRKYNLFEKIWLRGGHTMTDTHYTLHITPHYCSQQNSQILPSRGIQCYTRRGGASIITEQTNTTRTYMALNLEDLL